MAQVRTYISIDLKSFYASQECVERGLDPLVTNLVVADMSRTEKTICLAVTPALKSFGVSGRARLFEAIQRVKEVNAQRLYRAPGQKFTGKSCNLNELRSDPSLELDFIVAPPRMAHYVECSAKIYQIYLRYVAPEDIHVYSIDEVFIDATPYLKTYGFTAREFAEKMIYDVLRTTGITATAGIGPNLFLCKIALDIVAKRIDPDRHGVRIAELNETQFRRELWSHRPLTDFWRVGRGYASKLEAHGIFTMGDVARTSLSPSGQNLLYKLFGVNAELLIDHAWGWEPATLDAIKAYRPESNSLGAGQVLQYPYPNEKARLIVKEMADSLVLDLVDKGLVTDQIVLTVGYDRESLLDVGIRNNYKGEVTTDFYGRKIPKHAHGTANLGCQTASAKRILQAVTELFDRIVDPSLLVRRLNLTACHVVPETEVRQTGALEQLDFFSDPEALQKESEDLEREKRRQQAVLEIRKKYGKNAILKGMNFEEGATAKDRNQQIGGHKA